MSNGEKKPGVKDISDLKARLGMLNKGVGAKPSMPGPADAPPPSSATVLTEESDAELGMETQVVRLEPREAAPDLGLPSAPPVETPRSAPRTIPGPPAAAPPPSVGMPLNLGADLFKKPEPPPEPLRPAPAAAAAAAAARAAAAPPPPAPIAPPPQEKFVNPLAAVNPQRALTADDEAALNAVEKGQKGVRPAFLIVIAGACAVIAGIMGFMGGTGSIQRELLNMQAKEAATVRDRMVPILQKMEELANVVEPMGMEKVEWAAVQAMPADLPGIDAAGILSTRVTLPADVMSPLGKAVADVNQLFQLAVDHRRLTLERDKAELEAMEKGSSFSSNQYFAGIYQPMDPKTPPLKYIPPPAQIVAVVDKPHPDEKGEFNLVKVKYRGGQETEVPLQRLVLVDKSELFEGGRQNVLSLYKQRVEFMKQKIKVIRTYSSNLKEKLNAEAARAQ